MYSDIFYIKDIKKNVFDNESKYLIFIAEDSKEMFNELERMDIKFYGAIFPQIIFDKQNYTNGAIIFKLKEYVEPFIIENIKDDITQFKTNITGANSLITIVDGLSDVIDYFLEEFYEIIDSTTKIIGGGAGLLTLKQEPVIFSNDGIYEDSALIIPLKDNIEIGVQHGWEKIYGPLVSTYTQKNILKTIDYENAFEVYKEIVEKDSNQKFTEDNFFDISKKYPIGIEKINGEVVVRDPIARDGNDLILVGQMDQNSVIYILKGESDKLIQSASKVSKSLMQDKKEIEYIFLVDCISRVLFLEDKFEEEIQAVKNSDNDTQLFGILTLGEIANNSKTYIEFYNKTCVVGIG